MLSVTGRECQKKALFLFQMCLLCCPHSTLGSRPGSWPRAKPTERQRLPYAGTLHTVICMRFFFTLGGTVQLLTVHGVRELGPHGPASYPISDLADQKTLPRVCQL